jgi:hypothetical protein
MARAKENDMNLDSVKPYFERVSGRGHHGAIKESKGLLASSNAGAQSRRKEGANFGHGRIGRSSDTSAAGGGEMEFEMQALAFLFCGSFLGGYRLGDLVMGGNAWT